MNAQLKKKISIMMLAALAVVGIFACTEKVSAARQGAAWEAAQIAAREAAAAAEKAEDEAREKGRRGGLRSGEVRREKRTLKELALALMEGKPKGEKDANGVAAVAAMFAEARRGNVSAFRALAELMGEFENPEISIETVSPFVLGMIPQDMVDKAKRDHDQRQLENGD